MRRTIIALVGLLAFAACSSNSAPSQKVLAQASTQYSAPDASVVVSDAQGMQHRLSLGDEAAPLMAFFDTSRSNTTWVWGSDGGFYAQVISGRFVGFTANSAASLATGIKVGDTMDTVRAAYPEARDENFANTAVLAAHQGSQSLYFFDTAARETNNCTGNGTVGTFVMVVNRYAGQLARQITFGCPLSRD